MKSNEPEGLGSSPSSVVNLLQNWDLPLPLSRAWFSCLYNEGIILDGLQGLRQCKGLQGFVINYTEKRGERGPGVLSCSFPTSSPMANKWYNWDFKATLDTIFSIYPAIFVAAVVPLFLHLSIHLCYKHSLSTFSMHGNVLNTRKHEKRSIHSSQAG